MPVFETNFFCFSIVKVVPGDEKALLEDVSRFVRVESRVSSARYEYFAVYDEIINRVKPFFKYDASSGFRRPGFLFYGLPKSGKTAFLMKMSSMDKRMTTFLLRIQDFGAGDLKPFFEEAKKHDPAVIIIEDLDQVLGPDGKVAHLKHELYVELFNIHYSPWYLRNRVMVIGETIYPFELDEVHMFKFFKSRVYLPLVPVKMREEYPKPAEWRSREYFGKLNDFKDDSEALMKKAASKKQGAVMKFMTRALCIRE